MTTNAELAGRLRSEAEKAEAQTGQPKEDFFWWETADAITSLEAQLVSARKALQQLYNFWEFHPDCRPDAPVIRQARAALSDEQG